MQYITVKDYGTDFFIEKKSKFIAYCRPVQTEEQAEKFIDEIKKKHKDATHNVWAYRLRENNIERFNDDGEPQGTAGIPVLDVMKKSNTLDTVIVATRYFGGVMLGGGGLVRAYSHTASLALASAVLMEMKECVLAQVKCEYSYYAKFQDYCSKNNTVIDDTQFEDKVILQIHALENDIDQLQMEYSELTNGTGKIEEIERNFYGFPKK